MLAYIFIFFFGVKTTPLKKSTSVNSPKSTLGSDTQKGFPKLRTPTCPNGFQRWRISTQVITELNEPLLGGGRGMSAEGDGPQNKGLN